MSPLVPRTAESLANPVFEPLALPVVMPPYPWDDARFAEPEGMSIPEYVTWARATFVGYPAYLYRLLHPALPHTYIVED